MTYSKNKTAILIGYGGMGKRYALSLKNLKFKIIAISDTRQPLEKSKIPFYKNYKELIQLKADLVCIATNTTSRYKILLEFIRKSPIKNIITEKPFSCSIKESLVLEREIKKSKKKIMINSYRPLLQNFIQIKKILKKNNEDAKSIIINSPFAGIGNMGSIFFDLALYFFQEKPLLAYCKIKKSTTPNPRGREFQDPGGYGIITFKKNKRLIFDLSEDTGLPYTICIKRKNFEFMIDEINNKFYQKRRSKLLDSKPLYYYLFSPKLDKLKVFEKYNPIHFTEKTINEIFKKNYRSNIQSGIQVVKMIMACHLSSKSGREIQIEKIGNNKIYIPFA